MQSLSFLLILVTGLCCSAGAEQRQPVASILSTSITNPTPGIGDQFGTSVAALGSNHVIVGAYRDDLGATDAGAAHLFEVGGKRIVTFSQPVQSLGAELGISVAALGDERVLVGAWGVGGAGRAFLFGTNGSLLSTLFNPSPNSYDVFGRVVAALGSEGVLVGDPGNDNGTYSDVGVGYLFNTNGVLVTTFTNPAPAASDQFGTWLSALGDDRVLIGASQSGTTNPGVAYLFSTNGSLLTTFTNPTPEPGDAFGFPVAAVGRDFVMVGAYSDDAGGTNSGAAYLFNTNGALVTSFANPTPSAGDWFGYAVVAVGTECVLVSAPFDDTAGQLGGAAYLFRTNGTLLATMLGRDSFDRFGFSVASGRREQVIIGAQTDGTGAQAAGAAYIFNLVPSLEIRRTPTNTLAVAWPLFSTAFSLQQNTNGLGTTNWSNVMEAVQVDGTNNYTVIPPGTNNRFYRLAK